jgi:endoglucanase Acf2/endonuclease/exonuclease/phosphatase family metal-dependent hydrolase
MFARREKNFVSVREGELMKVEQRREKRRCERKRRRRSNLLQSLETRMLLASDFGQSDSMLTGGSGNDHDSRLVRLIEAGQIAASPLSGSRVPTSSSGAPLAPLIDASFDQPVPSTDWWSSVQFPAFGNAFSAPLHAHPLTLEATSRGLLFGAPSSFNGFSTGATTGEAKATQRYDLQVDMSAAGMASDFALKDYSDWAFTGVWRGTTNEMELTAAQGSPFAWLSNVDVGEAVVRIQGSPEFVQVDGNEAFVRVNGRTSFVLAPPSVEIRAVAGGLMFLSDPAASAANSNYLVLGMLPEDTPQIRQEFLSVALNRPAQTHFEHARTDDGFNLQVGYEYFTEDGNPVETILALYPHLSRLSDDISTVSSEGYLSPRGPMHPIKTGSVEFDLPARGVLPNLPPLLNETQRDELSDLIRADDNASDPARYLSGFYDTYWSGKAMLKLSQLAQMADVVGEIEIRDRILNAIKDELNDWFRTTGESGDKHFAYNAQWNTLQGYPDSFGSAGDLNDHHFHYGYFVHAAALVGLVDPAWAIENRDMVDLLIADVAGHDPSSVSFPELRSFSPMAGHSWASGHGAFSSGNNQESSSEAMNFATGVTLWGEAIGNNETRQLGQMLYSVEAEAIAEYWFDRYGTVYPESYDHESVGMVWGDGAAHATWFSAEPELIKGINFLPFHGGSLYLSEMAADSAALLAEIEQLNGGPADDWPGIVLQYEALVDPAAATTRYQQQTPEYEAGQSPAYTFFWVSVLGNLGTPISHVRGDHPVSAVFENENVLTYSAHNASPEVITVSFNDGVSFNVQPGESATRQRVQGSEMLTDPFADGATDPGTDQGNYDVVESVGSVDLLVERETGIAFVARDLEAPVSVTRYGQWWDGDIPLKRGDWQLIAAAEDSLGRLRVLDVNPSAVNSYGWILDDSGLFIGEDVYDAGNITEAEVLFEFDLNNDGTIGSAEDVLPPIASGDVSDEGVSLRLMSFNVYYASLGAEWRIDGIAQAVADYQPDIASLQEMWGEKEQILAAIEQKTGLDYAFSVGSNTWDGDILYRRDRWTIVDDGVLSYDGSRGMSWASMKHRASGEEMLVYGIHPLAGVSEELHLENMEMATRHMQERSETPAAPVVFMGDFNASEYSESMNLLRDGSVDAFGETWEVPVTFEDTFRLANGPDANGDTGFGVKIDYIYTEERNAGIFRTKSAGILRDATGGSDHFPVTAEIVLLSAPVDPPADPPADDDASGPEFSLVWPTPEVVMMTGVESAAYGWVDDVSEMKQLEISIQHVESGNYWRPNDTFGERDFFAAEVLPGDGHWRLMFDLPAPGEYEMVAYGMNALGNTSMRSTTVSAIGDVLVDPYAPTGDPDPSDGLTVIENDGAAFLLIDSETGMAYVQRKGEAPVVVTRFDGYWNGEVPLQRGDSQMLAAGVDDEGRLRVLDSGPYGQFAWILNDEGLFMGEDAYGNDPPIVAETIFTLDVNGDGVIGEPSATLVVIEDDGEAALLEDPTNGIAYIQRLGELPVVVTRFDGYWNGEVPVERGAARMLAAGVDEAGRLRILDEGNNRYYAWILNDAGTFIGEDAYGNSPPLKAETIFTLDLNGDGVIGPVNTGDASEFGQGLLVPGEPSAYDMTGFNQGEFLSNIHFSHRLKVDPIVNPGAASSHMHDFFANPTTNADSNVASLLKADESAANPSNNLSVYWTPSFIDEGADGLGGDFEYITPLESSIAYYSILNPYDPAQLEATPTGLQIIVGEGMPDKRQSPEKVFWNYIGESKTYDHIPLGDEWRDLPLQAVLIFPQFWDGENLDSPDHQSHMAYGKGVLGGPSTHPVMLPQLQLQIHYGHIPNRLHMLSSDYMTMGHADFAPGWSLHADHIHMPWPERDASGELYDGFERRVEDALRFPLFAGLDGNSVRDIPTGVQQPFTAVPMPLLGTSTSDVIVGTEGNDRIEGLEGSDVLNGGAGADLLIGADGADRFVVSTLTDSTRSLADRILGFDADDTLDLSSLGLLESDLLLQQMGDVWLVMASGHDFMVIVVTPQLSRAQILI